MICSYIISVDLAFENEDDRETAFVVMNVNDFKSEGYLIFKVFENCS